MDHNGSHKASVARFGSRDLLATASALRWYLARREEPDPDDEQILEYEAADMLIGHLETSSPGLRALVEAIEEAARLAVGLSLARRVAAPGGAIASLEQAARSSAEEVAALRRDLGGPDLDEVLRSYARLADLALVAPNDWVRLR